MSKEFIPYDVILSLTSDDESYVLYQSLNEFCSTIIRARPAPANLSDSDDEALLRAAQSLKSRIHAAWMASENVEVPRAGGVHHHEHSL